MPTKFSVKRRTGRRPGGKAYYYYTVSVRLRPEMYKFLEQRCEAAKAVLAPQERDIVTMSSYLQGVIAAVMADTNYVAPSGPVSEKRGQRKA